MATRREEEEEVVEARRPAFSVSSRNADGRLELILGPMFSGKSSELLRRARRLAISGKRVVFVRPLGDDRWGAPGEPEAEAEAPVTHDRLSAGSAGPHKIRAVRVKRVAELETLTGLGDTEAFAIDEGQFFPDLARCDALADAGLTVLVAALDGDFQRKAFPEVLSLIGKADEFVKLSAICARPSCGREAAFTLRLGAENDPRLLVGGAERYRPVCRRCRAELAPLTGLPELAAQFEPRVARRTPEKAVRTDLGPAPPPAPDSERPAVATPRRESVGEKVQSSSSSFPWNIFCR